MNKNKIGESINVARDRRSQRRGRKRMKERDGCREREGGRKRRGEREEREGGRGGERERGREGESGERGERRKMAGRAIKEKAGERDCVRDAEDIYKKSQGEAMSLP